MTDLVASLVAYVTAMCGAVKVDVHATGVAARAVGPATTLRWEGDACASHPRLRLHYSSAEGVATLPVQPSLTVWVAGFEVPAAVEADVEVTGVPAEVPVEPRFGRPVTTAGPWRTRRPLAGGAVLTERVVEAVPAAVRGATVDVVVRRGSVVLSVPGRLLADGQIGERVRVRHDAADRVLTGVLVAPSRVEIP